MGCTREDPQELLDPVEAQHLEATVAAVPLYPSQNEFVAIVVLRDRPESVLEFRGIGTESAHTVGGLVLVKLGAVVVK